ncbi:MAG TPA: DNA mismatch repair endonuclease MutL [Candidatus Eremiobacteraeota bacterium]|nr:MAG: DNA mismatch repair protein MutL [bacterium ADurb.Bin363]HPZ09937.1 DNA mismatch repair endonuclease MutL [Candidatus Eremiobacteraeota bacterium]
MPDIIKILDKEVTEKIAAGEVIEKPASVVKELVENSLDAGSSRVEIELRDGGRNKIKVIDNGSGMSPGDAMLSFTRHATSKIRGFEDLSRIVSMGFRGEALASISAVSRVELITKEAGKTLGRKVKVEGGKYIEHEETGCPEGTCISVEDLFFNVPARRKFLSSAKSEQAAINKVLLRMSLAYPEVFFSLSSDQKKIFSYAPVPNTISRVEQIYGKEVEGRLLEIEGNCNEASLRGLISHPSCTFANRSRIFMFVNRRFVKPVFLYKLIHDSFQKLIPSGRFPAVIIFLEISPELIDINIHPTKEDIRFSKEGIIFSLIRNTIKDRLNRDSGQTTIAYYNLPLRNEKIFNSGRTISYQEDLPDFHINIIKESPLEKEMKILHNYKGLINQTPDMEDPVIIGNFKNTYIIARTDKALLLIDQHVAHERINFEILKKHMSENTRPLSQTLLFPITIDFPPHEKTWLEEHLSLFSTIGYDIESFGENTFLLRGVPPGLEKINHEESFKDIVSKFSLSDRTVSLENMFNHIMATIACKASIKAGDELSIKEMEELIKKLFKTPDHCYCPHGRPVIISFSERDLAKLFKRE